MCQGQGAGAGDEQGAAQEESDDFAMLLNYTKFIIFSFSSASVYTFIFMDALHAGLPSPHVPFFVGVVIASLLLVLACPHPCLP